ncbi:sugar ABC transporter permease [Natronospirillum operosum]|uniref:Sugar ABC transporter permease n=1 Tax=Natronospirillum operosum TaxID=2759953 RepID=A0A4Z0WAG5_9GAMM|nr:sugar ABC transporter permease [Natronospirillum operosum]TGG90650.1 sugar ABC transporter permease [Natronospirillum operosum]
MTNQAEITVDTPDDERSKEVRSGRLKRFLENGTPYWFLSPYIIIFGTFGIFPVFFMIFLSFHTWNPVAGLGSMRFVGLENYALSLTDPRLWKTMWNTIAIAVMSGLAQHLVALPMAYLLISLGARARHWLSTAYFLPYVTSTVAVSMIFYIMYSPQSGIINQGLNLLANGTLTSWAFGWIGQFQPIGWLQENSLIRYSISFVVFWKYVGFNIVIYAAGLSTINQELYEAAKIDGASHMQRFRYVALPLLKPFIFFAVTLTIIGNMQLFDEPYVLTRGLQQATSNGMTISNYLYRIGWEWLDMGSAAAVSWILFVVIALFTGLYFWLFGRQGLGGNE